MEVYKWSRGGKIDTKRFLKTKKIEIVLPTFMKDVKFTL